MRTLYTMAEGKAEWLGLTSGAAAEIIPYNPAMLQSMLGG